MKVDPNQPVDFRQEAVLCERGGVVLHDGASTPASEVEEEESAFKRFCRSLDPNKCFIVAFIPDDADRHVFFAARESARSMGLHMQATVDTPERLRALWETYKTMKQYADAESDDLHAANDSHAASDSADAAALDDEEWSSELYP